MASPEPKLRRLAGDRIRLTLLSRLAACVPATGPALRGVPAGTSWFVPIDDRCVGPTGVSSPPATPPTPASTHGGIGAQQADTAAAGIVHLARLGARPPPLGPVIQGMLMSGWRPLVRRGARRGRPWLRSEVYGRPSWPADQRIIAAELAPYLARGPPVAQP